ncbi:FRG domain-containing protein [Actinomyces sp. B33]|uniref:FRG domain-containing protein n=1 Tax=Actinomyces sp. B33 TaxID=2942131 RepID=UPI002341ACED|nr:FRG domain-containing protein [Actinomyces sp. B33]MDC4233166.1 FRG domain-containing protein [Actinomyces sp. B33]
MTGYRPLGFDASSYLTEREYSINALTADDFYRRIAKVLDGLTSHTSLNAQLGGSLGSAKKLLLYRGQADENWALTSSLYRRIVDKFGSYVSVDEVENVMRRVENEMLEKCEKDGWLRGFKSFERLAVMQHYGVPTRLLDVTSDWRVALYFSCEFLSDCPDIDGRLFLLTINVRKGERSKSWISSDDADPMRSNNVSWVDKYVSDHSAWPVLLTPFDSRIAAQRASFLVGGLRLPKIDSGSNLRRWLIGNVQKEESEVLVSALPINFLPPGPLRFREFSSGVKDLLRVSPGYGEESLKVWSASAISLRVPSRFKASLCELLRKDGVSREVLFPNVELQMNGLSEFVEAAVVQLESGRYSRFQRKFRESMGEFLLEGKKSLRLSSSESSSGM